MLLGAVGAFTLVQHLGAGLTAPAAPAGAASVAAPKAGRVDVVLHVLATLAAVIGLGFALGRLFRYLGQPPVIGEVVAGILLGPSLLGAISPEAMHWLIPGPDADPGGQVRAALKAVAQLGVVLYMFLVGLDLDAGKLRHQAHSTVAISHASIVAPFVLGSGLALVLYPRLSHQGVPFTSFALFLGTALSVTAFPVLARILADRRLEQTEAGTVALGCAAADDVTAWCLLAFVVGVAQAEVGAAAATTAGAVGFILAMFFVVRPVAAWACRKVEGSTDRLPPAAVPVVLVAVLVCALATEAIGVHAVFGAFLLGAVLPHNGRLAREVTARLKDVVTVLLLPAFFALAGLRTEVGLIAGWENWLLCGLIVLVATLGKWGGTCAAARFSGYDRRTALALGAMMNTRGLMGLIVLDLGLGLGVISPALFAMMVLMALVTTMATAPALRRLLPAPG
ncbi:MAG: cation:proton antiporter [Gemmataceae bacterium]|nr:cation:proton antiporter [Gemmataceae bacterium]